MTLAADHPVHSCGLDLAEAPGASDHGLPLGNGLLGATVWGDGVPLKLSLDRGDLWDLREVPEFSGPGYTWAEVARAHQEGRHEALSARLEAPYYRAGPTKIPAGRIELDAGGRAVRLRLDRAAMLARVEFEGGGALEAFVSAVAPVGRMRGRGLPPTLRLAAPPFDAQPPGWVKPTGFTASFNDVWELGYPPPVTRVAPESLAFGQKGWGGFASAVGLAWRESPDGWDAAWRIEVRQGDEPLDALIARTLALTGESAAEPFDRALAAHAGWWAARWGRARVDLPDPVIARAYYAGLGMFDAAARPGAPPAPLQGPWTSDTGRLPPWKGDYHHDLNTQMTYWPAYAGDRLDASTGFLDWLWDTREACRAWTRAFYEVGGLNVPMTADLLNRQIGGWRQYTHSVSSAAWLAQHFHLHWRFGGDAAFLRERAHPYLTEVCVFVDEISRERDARGLRRVRLSSSPEIGDNRPEAWFDVLTNYDVVLFRGALGWAAEMADALGLAAEAERWRKVAGELPEMAQAEDGRLLVAPGMALPDTHRHFSHAMAIHPLGLLRPLDRPEDMRVADATLDELDRLGTGMWMGYSFAWRAALLARAGRGEAAAADLRVFETHFTYPNGFHANGDWAAIGHSRAVFGAFTMEGNSAAVAAVHEMLLQSAPGALRLFPAVPAVWGELAFDGLRADGAVLVSARLSGGRLVEARLVAERPLRVALALRRAPPALTLTLAAGETRTLTAAELDRLNAYAEAVLR